MQALWSRAAQTRSSCRCSSCLHAATTLARRTTTAASKRRLRVGDLFTACYSTILATAAVADAKVKDDRRKEWDRLITEAKIGASIQESEPAGPTNTLPDSEYLSSQLPSHKHPAFKDFATQIKPLLATTITSGTTWTTPTTQDTPLEIKLRSLDSRLTQSIELCSEESAQDESNHSSSSELDNYEEWVDEELDPELLPREPKTTLHLGKMEAATANLVDQLLLKTKFVSSQGRAGLSKGSDIFLQLKGMAKRIYSLKSNWTHFPAYAWENDTSVEVGRSSLNKSLYAVCRKTTPDTSNIDLMLAKICYNLLICTVPPNTTTYNILISELLRLRQHDTTQVVIDSFLDDTRFKPTKRTMVLILDHYKAKNDQSGFRAIIRRMRAVDGDMRVKSRSISDLHLRAVREWALSNKVIQRGHYLHQKMYRDANVFNSLIRDSLKLKGVRHAIRFIRAAFRESNRVQEQTFCAVARACVNQWDYMAGHVLLKAILSLWKGSQVPSIMAYSSKVRYFIYKLLKLCLIDPSLDSTQTLPHDVSRDALQNMLRYMQLESINDDLDEFARRIKYMETVLGVSQPDTLRCLNLHDTPISVATHKIEGIETACKMLRNSSRNAKRREASGEKFTIWTRLAVLELKVAAEADRLAEKQEEVATITFNMLLPKQQMEYDTIIQSQICSREISMSEKLDVLLDLARQRRLEQWSRKVQRQLRASRKRIICFENEIKELGYASQQIIPIGQSKEASTALQLKQVPPPSVSLGRWQPDIPQLASTPNTQSPAPRLKSPTVVTPSLEREVELEVAVG